MPARPWPDGPAGSHGPAGWRQGLAARLRGIAERIDPAGRGPSVPGAVPGTPLDVPPGTGLVTGSPTPARGFDLSGAPEHWVRLLRDAGLAPAEGGSAAGDGSTAGDGSAAGAATDDAASIDEPTVRRHFGLSRMRKLRLQSTTARMSSSAAVPKSPTTAASTRDLSAESTRIQDRGPIHGTAPAQATARTPAAHSANGPVAPLARPVLRPFGAPKDVEQASQRADNAVPTLRLRPDRNAPSNAVPPVPGSSPTAGSQLAEPSHAMPPREPQPAPTLMTPLQPTHTQRTPTTSASTDQTTAPRNAPHVVRPALRLSARSKDVEQASQRAGRGSIPAPRTPGPAPASAKPKTPPTAVALPHAAEGQQPEPKTPHASTPQHPAPKPPLTGTWPELAPKPSPQPTAPSSEHFEHALARAARLSIERSAV